MANTSNSMEIESPSMFAVFQEQEGKQYRQVNTGCVEDMQEEEDCVFAGSQVYRVGGCGQDRVRSADIQKQYMMYQGRRYINPTCPTTCPTILPFPTSKSVRFPGRSRKGSVIRVPTSHSMNGHPVVEMSNMYTMLDHRLDCM